jgi:hypothetical protein
MCHGTSAGQLDGEGGSMVPLFKSSLVQRAMAEGAQFPVRR